MNAATGVCFFFVAYVALQRVNRQGEERPPPQIPTERPKPRATPKTVKLQTFHLYRFEADALPVHGLGDLAEKAFATFGLSKDVNLVNYYATERDGREVTRVIFEGRVLVDREVPLEREHAIAGVGSVWIVKVTDLGVK